MAQGKDCAFLPPVAHVHLPTLLLLRYTHNFTVSSPQHALTAAIATFVIAFVCSTTCKMMLLTASDNLQ
eukprot:12900850-Prorocentrum_lima.AAC.1